MDQQRTDGILRRIAEGRASGDARILVQAFEAGMVSGRPVPGLDDAALDCLADVRSAVRNAGAMALVDSKCPAASVAIRAALLRPGVAAQSGSLVYALVELGGTISPSEAAHIAREGSYEARGELVELLRGDRLDLTDRSDLPGVLERLDDMVDGLCDDAGNAASEILAALGRMGIRHHHALTV